MARSRSSSASWPRSGARCAYLHAPGRARGWNRPCWSSSPGGRQRSVARRALRGVVRTAFSRRRKQLVNVLAPLTAEPRALLAALDIDPQRRPETLAPADFVRLTRALERADA
jgi:hypothetical protein